MLSLQHTLTQLTLHEALTVFRPDFIQQSCERQRALREGQWRRRRREGGHRPPPLGCREEVPQSKRTPKFFFVGGSSPSFTSYCQPQAHPPPPSCRCLPGYSQCVATLNVLPLNVLPLSMCCHSMCCHSQAYAPLPPSPPPADASNCRPRMSMRQMYEQTKR